MVLIRRQYKLYWDYIKRIDPPVMYYDTMIPADKQVCDVPRILPLSVFNCIYLRNEGNISLRFLLEAKQRNCRHKNLIAAIQSTLYLEVNEKII